MKSVFKLHKTIQGWDRRLEEETSEVPHLTPGASPFQLETHLWAALIIALVAQTVEGKSVSDQNKPTCSPNEHFTLWFLQHTPAAQGKVSLQTRILNESLTAAPHSCFHSTS